MATAFSYSTGVVHFRYLSQKATANPVLAQFQKTTGEHSHNIFHSANPVLGHAMTKLLKPLHITRIGVRALRNSCRIEIGFNGKDGNFQECHRHPISSERVKYDCEDRILEVLKSNRSTNLTNLAKDLSNILKHIGTHTGEEWGLVHLYKKILAPVHISRMWEIAAYNDTDNAADMLLLDNHSRVKWGGRSVNVKEGTLDRKRKWDDEASQEPLKEFPLQGEWEMELQCGNGEEYTVVFKDKSSLVTGWFSGWFSGGWFSGGRFSGKKKAQVFVEKNLNGIPDGVKTSDLAFVFGDKSSRLARWFLRWFSGGKKGQVFVKKNLNGFIPAGVKASDLAFVFGADGPWPSSNPFVIYMRAAGPNVLIGQAWTGGENSKRLWAEVILVKRK